MIRPPVLRPDRLRLVPPHFSWVDHLLVRDRHIQRCDANAWALYLFLVTVGNAQGLSWYADHTLAGLLNMSEETLVMARRQLVLNSLVAFSHPFYQVLDLQHWQPYQSTLPKPTSSLPSAQGPELLRDILQRLGGGA